MELGHCPRCQHPYTVSEVVGFGVLRPRAASAGGPRMEYACTSCGRLIQLIPHGNGRYAPPGEPPPQVVPESARRPPWASGRATGGAGGRSDAWNPGPQEGAWEHSADPAGASGGAPRSHAEGPSAAEGAAETASSEEREAEISERSMGPAEALELLGVSPTAGADEIERAFRERSLTCHPDKVAHLDRDFQELAERKFKRLRQALDILKA